MAGQVKREETFAEPGRSVGLVYVNDEMPGISRRKRGRGFSYSGPDGKPIRNSDVLKRIRSIVIPPAWTDVWIAPDPEAQLQATGRDARGRKQYRYHPAYQALREEAKYEHIFDFARALPKIRAAVDQDMRRRGLPWEKVAAIVVYLLDKTLIRIGNSEYARTNGSFGLTTLRDRHVEAGGETLRFEFKGKSGKTWRLRLRDRRAARIVKQCQDLPGQHLFQFVDEDGERRAIGSVDVNAYLRDISGRDITAKDFRTWAGTVLAAMTLQEFEAVDSVAAARTNLREAIERVSARLGNTPTICRKCYIHPEIINSYLDGALLLAVEKRASDELRDSHLAPEEVAVLAFLRGALRKEKRRRREQDAEPPRKAA